MGIMKSIGKLFGVKPPKKGKQSQAERVQAQVSAAEWNRWKNNFGTLLPELSRKLDNEDVRSGLRARSNADLAQTVGNIGLGQVQSTDFGSDVEQARLGQLRQANVQAQDFKTGAQTDLLAMGQQQRSVTNKGLGALARIEGSTALKRLSEKQRGNMNRANNAAKAVMSGLSAGISNANTLDPTTGQTGSFFTPKVVTGTDTAGNFTYGDASRLQSLKSFL